MKDVEFINNIELIVNNLAHIVSEYSQESPSFFRIAVESHNTLIRAMVQALKGGTNFPIDKKLSKEKKFTFCINGYTPVMIKKEKIEGCINAWKFSVPVEITREEFDNEEISRDEDYEKYLIGFYDLLAMIQCDYFMKYFSSAETIIIPNEDLMMLDWLHQKIRNEYEHFIPKSYGAPVNDLIYCSILCLDICKKLLVNTSNIYVMALKDIIKNQLDSIVGKLNDDFETISA